MDKHHAIYIIHQDIHDQLLIYILSNYFHQLNLNQMYQCFIDLTI